ncbi:amidohydrolase family protein [Maribacter algarum]|uniref:Amidohydrolase family protein n=1 Tax=Maribacter algarum (ex Zhang et al. 2020) TaxID=2578118 RepID=A0A5S3PPB7_9FLAO|nr:amidohydrolase family protein [Maribacter algarum]TMM56263.1 amidohydrolase family protein [Maribacter algarum]
MRANVLLFLFLAISYSGFSQNKILIKNVNVWDGTSNQLNKNVNVLIQDNLITKIGKNISESNEATIIDGRGQTLIPGLSDAHVHLSATMSDNETRNEAHWMYTSIRTAKAAENFLMLGFTTVRDLGGPVFGIKRGVDEGLIPGPRIYPSGAYISQTSGHGDFRNANEPSVSLSGGQMHSSDTALGWAFVVDGVPEVLKASRENLRKGATQLKVMAGGGIASDFDPIHSVQFTTEELEAAVQAAADWDTYVAVHIYESKGAIRSLNAGVKCLDHGHLLNEEVIKLIKEKDAWLVPQAFWNDTPASFWVPGSDKIPDALNKKIKPVLEGTDTVFKLAKKYDINVGFGSDAYGDLGYESYALTEFTSRAKWFSPLEILKQATSENARLFSLSGKINPYTDGKLGVIEVGAYADLLIYEGNPLEDIEIVAHPEKHLKLIMKDGKVYKNEL